MAKYAYPIPNGKVRSEGLTKLISTLYTGSGVIYGGSLTVAASGTPDMNVVVSGSQKDDVAVFIGDEGIAYTGWNTAAETVAIDANGTGVTMKDTIVAYIDLAAGDTVTANAPDGLKFIAVRGASTDTAPTDSAIDTAVGHSHWTRLADVSVSSGATSINSGNITDVRTQAQLSGSHLEYGSVTTAKIASEAWSTWTPTLSGGGSMTVTAGSIGEARYQQVGSRVYYSLVIGFTTGGTANPVVKFTAPVNRSQTVAYAAAGNGSLNDGGLVRAAFCMWSGSLTDTIEIRRFDEANWSLGVGRVARISGFYEVA